jgi:hypothetical protein
VADLDGIIGQVPEPRPELLGEIVERTRHDRLEPATVEPRASQRGQLDRPPITDAEQFGPMTPTPFTCRLGLQTPAQMGEEARSSDNQEQCAMCGASFVPQLAHPVHCPDCFRRTRRHQRN